MNEKTSTITYTRGQFSFNALAVGNPDREAIVLLHGFPADAESWLPVADQLARTGYRVLVPEQRGYSPTARPRSLRAYRVGELAADVAELITAAGLERAHVVGHDWGGGVAWEFAGRYPELVSSLTIVSAPHPRAFLASMWRSRQIFLSWYMLIFQIPRLAEWVFTRRSGTVLMRMLTGSGLNRNSASRYVQRMQQEGALTAALNWYRAMLVTVSKTRPIESPTLLVCGGRDSYVTHKAAQLTEKWVSGRYELRYLPQETHWIPEESADLLAQTIQSFISPGTPVGAS